MARKTGRELKQFKKVALCVGVEEDAGDERRGAEGEEDVAARRDLVAGLLADGLAGQLDVLVDEPVDHVVQVALGLALRLERRRRADLPLHVADGVAHRHRFRPASFFNQKEPKKKPSTIKTKPQPFHEPISNQTVFRAAEWISPSCHDRFVFRFFFCDRETFEEADARLEPVVKVAPQFLVGRRRVVGDDALQRRQQRHGAGVAAADDAAGVLQAQTARPEQLFFLVCKPL